MGYIYYCLQIVCVKSLCDHSPGGDTYPIALEISHLYLQQGQISQNLQVVLQIKRKLQ